MDNEPQIRNILVGTFQQPLPFVGSCAARALERAMISIDLGLEPAMISIGLRDTASMKETPRFRIGAKFEAEPAGRNPTCAPRSWVEAIMN